MCVGSTHKVNSLAFMYLTEAKNAVNMRQYQKALDRLDQAAEELDQQRKGLRKFLEKELEDKQKRFEPTETNRAKLQGLNDQLTVIQEEVNKDVQEIKEGLKGRLRDQKDFLTDYEIEIELEFYLRDDDPEYSQDEDAILVSIRCGDYIGVEGQEDLDYADGPMRDFLPFPHCALFHALHDHITPKNLHWSDLLRIGSVWVDIKATYQKHYRLESSQLVRDKGIWPRDCGIHYNSRQ